MYALFLQIPLLVLPTTRLQVDETTSQDDAVQTQYPYTIVDTNQTDCYDTSGAMTCPNDGEAMYGQDAQYQRIPPSYWDNGDGTVLDENTGLVWQQGFQRIAFNAVRSDRHWRSRIVHGAF